MKLMRKIGLITVILSMIMALASCSGAGDGYYGGGYGPSKGDAAGAPEADGATGEDVEDETDDTEEEKEITLPAGMITAGAWNDNDNYSFWLEQFVQGEENGKFYNYTIPNNSWGYNSLNRVKVHVTNGEDAFAGAKVVASDGNGNILYSAITDTKGDAYLFPEVKDGTITVEGGSATATVSFTAESSELTVDLGEADKKLNVIEIMLVVDVTGSMGDEITFLKAELADVINRIAANDSEAVIKLAMLFYRDTDDDVPFDYYDFTDVTTESGMAAQQTALNNQRAKGGGDYPEAVDEALNIAVGKQWSTGATTKIIFQVLDAPAHYGTGNAQKLVNATKTAAEKGIRICPIICSGAAEATEYTMREAAIYTGGTFIFVTDDSGIGGEHHDPELPNVTVELLNSLMVRLVNGYHTGTFADPVYWKDDPGLATEK